MSLIFVLQYFGNECIVFIYSAGSHLSAGISACCDDIKLV